MKRDARCCPHCGSADVKSTRELVDQTCPKCKEGKVRRGSPIRWKLDADRAPLPVPQIVKDLVAYMNPGGNRDITPALEHAKAIVEQTPDTQAHACGVIFLHLLSWWEGDYFASAKEGGTEQKECSDVYDSKWPWIRAFIRVVRETPELAELVEWRDSRFCFKPTVGADVRRGIKNYIREHREHEVWS